VRVLVAEVSMRVRVHSAIVVAVAVSVDQVGALQLLAARKPMWRAILEVRYFQQIKHLSHAPANLILLQALMVIQPSISLYACVMIDIVVIAEYSSCN